MEQLMGTRGTDPRLRADEQPVWPGLFSGLLGSRMGPGEKKKQKKAEPRPPVRAEHDA